MNETLRAWVNGSPVDVPPGATALDCVRASMAEEGDAVVAGRRVITDSRGLPTDLVSAAHAGAIYRTIAARGSAAGE